MVNSSFHTENLDCHQIVLDPGSGLTYCWIYLGRHDMMYWPYLCRDSPFSLYWSAGFTMARLSLTASSRGANCSRVRSPYSSSDV